ncbi:MAG: bifunctional methylenetetrahydrofolate dehydrogenase/methenyltetrahydrofolate cyclohydrolase FolD [Bacteroides sp.]|jgi:methylenetetrahydrofolate dehydrogenase (NADP+)/methenyltetrahydrofolate cyclohydrolase|nr:bifunctional methylenetetrahydrofolate dehydrogenase/methenyltetrahydrofolate cyclohydrolase FolD [Bacteroides sp.]
MKLIDGKKIAEIIKGEIAAEVSKIKDADGKVPHLAAILVGEDAASQTYVNSKAKACHEVGFDSSTYRFPADISEEKLLETVDFINNDPEIDGLIVQLPLPKHIDNQKIIQRILPKKDVDGFHPINVGRMTIGLPAYVSATPNGIMQLIERSGIRTTGMNCVVLGRSNIVGKPMSILMSRNAEPGNATVTVCHSKTKNLKDITSQADILIVAMGQPEFVTADMVKEGAVVIDVGIHRVESDKTKSGFRLIGDVKFDEVSKKASHITPVPGGVGPMTIVSLLMNTLKAAKKEIYP